MKTRIIHESAAMVSLTAREAKIVWSMRVPMIYAPGGFGPDTPKMVGRDVPACEIEFAGPCFVDSAKKLPVALKAFRDALAAVIAAEDARDAEINAERAGQSAFMSVSGAISDGKFYKEPHCPFRRPIRIAAWMRGYGDMAAELAGGLSA